MSMERIRAEKHTCDGCGSITIVETGSEPVDGFHGDVFEVSPSGGRGGKFYACTSDCIAPAVLKVTQGDGRG